MSVRVKICGITEAEGLAAARGADWVGFNFFERSPRVIAAAQARALLHAAPDSPSPIGLFVRPDPDAVASVLAQVRLDGLQVYGPPEMAVSLRQRFGLPVWLAVGVAAKADLPTTCPVDGLVIEAKPPPGADRPGGNATGFDHAILRGWRAPVPWILAGGLSPETVSNAVGTSGATAVDVASGVESAPGLKSPDRIRAFIAAARRASTA